MPSCFIPGCSTGNGRGHHGPVHLFKCPRKASPEIRTMWESNVPKRDDRAWSFESSQLCHRHFKEEFIEKTKKVMMGSVIMAEEPRKQWTLTLSAVPTIFSNLKVPKYYDKTLTLRKPPKDRSVTAVALHQTPAPITEIEIATSSVEEVSSIHNMRSINLDELLLIELPSESDWIRQRRGCSVRICKILECNISMMVNFYVEKSLEVFSDCRHEVRVRWKDISHKFTNISSVEDVQKTLHRLSSLKLCSGAKNCNMFNVWPSAHKILNIWYADDCEQTTPETETCKQCQQLKSDLAEAAQSSLQKKRFANTGRITRQLMMTRKKNKANNLKVWRLCKKNEALKSLHEEFLKASEKSLEIGINNLENIPEPMRLAMITAVRNAKAKSKTGKRYAGEWLMSALLLKVKSPKGYRHARDTNMIPLPSPGHLSRLIRGIPCQYGFSDFIFMALEKYYRNKPRKDRQFVLLFDEMKVKEAIAFDKTTMKFVGFIDYGEFAGDYKGKPGSKKEADHCLVFMVRCLNSRMTQPIAAFATRGAAPGNILAKMILSCIVRLEAISCEVVGVTCDGATTNKSAWRFLGISGDSQRVVNKIVNPVDEQRYVHFFSDIPHVLKCIRNHLHKQGEAIYCGKRVNWGYYKAVYDSDKGRDLRLAPKLTPLLINPGPFQKMVVSHAAQIFSNTVATAIKFYRDVCGNVMFRGSEGTEEFTKLLNDVFDACNTRSSLEGIRPHDPKYKIIENFLRDLSLSDTFASNLTLASIRVTLQSILDTIQYLCEVIGFDYVLTAKFNQDCLEKFFGLVRSFGGDNSHPTASSFSHIFRLLSVYCTTSRSIKGNVRTDEEGIGAVSSYVDTLNGLRTTAIEKSQKVQSDLEDTLLEKIIYTRQSTDSPICGLGDHNYAMSQPSRCIVYNLTGFLVHKAKCFTKCGSCLKSLVDEEPSGEDVQLTAIKDLGGLKYPCKTLFSIVNDIIEPALVRHLATQQADPNFIFTLFDQLGEMNAYQIGCSHEHSPGLLANLVVYYTTIRLWFFTRNKNREELKSGNKTKNKMKEGKLA